MYISEVCIDVFYKYRSVVHTLTTFPLSEHSCVHWHPRIPQNSPFLPHPSPHSLQASPLSCLLTAQTAVLRFGFYTNELMQCSFFCVFGSTSYCEIHPHCRARLQLVRLLGRVVFRHRIIRQRADHSSTGTIRIVSSLGYDESCCRKHCCTCFG